jgi:hypothetical protein
MEIIVFIILVILLGIALFIYQVTRLVYEERRKYFTFIIYFSLFILALVLGIVIGHSTHFIVGGLVIFILSIGLFKTYYKNRW